VTNSGITNTGSGFGISSGGTGSTSGLTTGTTGTGAGTSGFGITGTGASTAAGTTTPAFTSSAGLYNSRSTGQTFFPGPTTSNPLAQYYVSPLKLGTTNAKGTATFGQPMYATVTTTTAGGAGARGAGGIGGTSGATTANAPPRFLLTLDLGNPAPPPIGRASVNVQNLVENSSLLSTNKNIQVNLDQGTVVLRGNVATERERRLAEGAVRLNGASLVRNELRVAP